MIDEEGYDALQYTGDNLDEVKKFLSPLKVSLEDKRLSVIDPSGDWEIPLEHWVMKRLNGELMGVIDPESFESYFEER